MLQNSIVYCLQRNKLTCLSFQFISSLLGRMSALVSVTVTFDKNKVQTKILLLAFLNFADYKFNN